MTIRTGVASAAAGGFPAPCSGQGAPCPSLRSAARLAIRTTYRREAIQCRSPQIRFFGLYYWIASHL
ncbi:MAG: hypothetical protein LBM98_11115 [Oscillospiraceae bacterium]|nr:hypothetical protein [Oscillospiraceae bacterium]